MSGAPNHLGALITRSYGKVVANLLRHGIPLEFAEDGMSQAVELALTRWTIEGVPHSAEGWLYTVARNKALDELRRRGKHLPLNEDLEHAGETAHDVEEIPDERLRLFFLCAHPALDRSTQVPLMLQLVCGLNAEEIASLYLVQSATMGQRLSRAKAKIRATGIPPSLPSEDQVPSRVQLVLDSLYGAFTHAWDYPRSSEHRSLTSQCIELTDALVSLRPEDPEARGLFALMLFCESRSRARRDEFGAYVPLDEQPTDAWDHRLIALADQALVEASKHRMPGRYQLEAAIQSAHTQRLLQGSPDWIVIVQLYDGLLSVSPTTGVRLGRIAAIHRAYGVDTALNEFNSTDWPETHQPVWALRAHLQKSAGQQEESRVSALRAAELAVDSSVANYFNSPILGFS